MNVYCYRSGQIGFSSGKLPDGALAIRFDATPDEVDTVKARSRLAYDNKTHLVPGIPEADDETAAYAAFKKFLDWLDFPAQERKTRRRGKR